MNADPWLRSSAYNSPIALHSPPRLLALAGAAEDARAVLERPPDL